MELHEELIDEETGLPVNVNNPDEEIDLTKEIEEADSVLDVFESRASFKKTATDDAEIDARVANIYNEIVSEMEGVDVDPDTLRDVAERIERGAYGDDDDLDDVLDGLSETLLKVKGFRTDPTRASGPRAVQIIAGLVQARDFLTELRSDDLLPLEKQKHAADTLIQQFDHELAELQRRQALVKATPAPLLASDGERIDATVRDIIRDNAIAALDGTSAEQHEAAVALLDDLDPEFMLDQRAEALSKERGISIPAAHAWASEHDPAYREHYTDLMQKSGRKDARKFATTIDTAAHEERLVKDRSNAKGIAYRKLVALARQAGVDPTDKAALDAWLRNTTEGRQAAEEYARFGSQVRRRTGSE